ncbi:hypothetical protein CPB85DRAFT_1205006, partial [Mucidula mucida]
EEPRAAARLQQGGEQITNEWLQTRTEADLCYCFGMSYPDIQEMVEGLCIPETIKTRKSYIFSGLKAFCILCACFRFVGNLFDLTIQYNRSISSLSEIINELVELLDDEWEHLLEYDHKHLLHPSQLLKYADAIHSHGAPIKHVFGFIDSIQRIARPTWHQQITYNGHKKHHALKFQALML